MATSYNSLAALIETLETRVLLSASTPAFAPMTIANVRTSFRNLLTLRGSRIAKVASAFNNTNISQTAGNQSEGAVAIDPSHPNRVFAVSNVDVSDGLYAAWSNDRGNTWHGRMMADGSDGLVSACCDSSAVFDSFGNLFVSYINAAGDTVQVVRSSDGGKTFGRVRGFTGDIDQPAVTAAKGMVWVTYQRSGSVVASGARVTGLGQVGSFSTQSVPGSSDGNFGDIAISAGGAVAVAFESPSGEAGPATIYVSVDPDGLGPNRFSKSVAAVKTKVGGFDFVPPQSSRSIDAEAGLAWDTSHAKYRGRLYMVYTDSPTVGSADTDIMLKYSTNRGATWSTPQRVNDDSTTRSQFMPRIALDSATGNVAVSWHDSRATARNQAQFWGTAGKPSAGGVTFNHNIQISAGTSDAAQAGNDIDFGDYTGLAFHGGRMIPVWSDNSNSTSDNPDGQFGSFDLYTAVVVVA